MATETAVIRLNESPDAPVRWVVVDDVGARPASLGEGPLNEALEVAEGRRVTVLVPADSVWRGSVSLPVKGVGRILQALPFALEEQLAEDVEKLHVAAGSNRDGRVEAAAVRSDLMEEWLTALSEAGISPRSIVSEIDALDHIPGTAVILMDHDRLLIRLPDGEALTGERADLEDLLDVCLTVTDEDEDEMRPLGLVIYCGDDDHASEARLWDRLRDRFPQVDIRILPDGALPRLAARVVASESVNLLQGAYAPRSSLAAHWPAWRLSAALLAACIVILLISGIANIFRLQREEAALDQAIAEAFQYTFPGAGEVRDARRQFESLRLAAGDSGPAGPGMLSALTVVGQAMGKETGTSIVSIGFRSGILDLRVLVPDVDTLDRVRQKVASAAGLTAEIQSANPEDGKVEGRLQVRVGQS